MKRIKQILIILLLAKTANLSTNALSTEHISQFEKQPAANHALVIFIKDLHNDKMITNTPLLATYGGYFVSSNNNGQIVFPRKTEFPEFYLVVTPNIIRNISILNNVSHLEILPQYKANMYHLILENNNWITTQVDIPESRHIPLQAIVILADTENIVIKVGKTPNLISNHLVLPNIYLTQTINNQHSLLIPNSRPFLANLNTAYSLTPYGYATIQVP